MIPNLALLGEYSTEAEFSFPRDLRLYHSRPASGVEPVLMLVVDLHDQDLGEDRVRRLSDYCSFLSDTKGFLPIERLSLEGEQLIAIQKWPNISAASQPRIDTVTEARQLLTMFLEAACAAEEAGFELDAFFPANVTRSGKYLRLGSLSSLAHLLNPDRSAPDPLRAIAATMVQLSSGESVPTSKSFILLDRHLPFDDIELFAAVKDLFTGTLTDPQAARQRLQPAPRTRKPELSRPTPKQSTGEAAPANRLKRPVHVMPQEQSETQLTNADHYNSPAPLPSPPAKQSTGLVPESTVARLGPEESSAQRLVSAEQLTSIKAIANRNSDRRPESDNPSSTSQLTSKQIGGIALAVFIFSVLLSLSTVQHRSSPPATANNSAFPNSEGEAQRPSTLKETCGSPSKPNSTWWAVIGPAELLDTVRATYCVDAYTTSEGIQAASFDSASKAAAFASYLSSQLGADFRVKDPQQPVSSQESEPAKASTETNSSSTPSQSTSAPQSTCGSNSGDTWWPVLGPADSLNLVKQNHCSDAYVNAEGSLQVASFNTEDVARAFAERLSASTGVSFRVGQPKTP